MLKKAPPGKELRKSSRYRDIATELQKEIRLGATPVGELLPTETELMARFAASRQTVREALRIITEQGLIVLVPATAHRRAYRDQVRARATRFIEVWMTASLDECRQRDAKGLYAQHSDGQVAGLPGADLAYEPPELPEVSARGGEDDQALLEILKCLSGPIASRQA